MEKLTQLPANSGIMICGHGSRDETAVREFENMANIIKKRVAPVPCEFGFLEFAKPIISDGLDKLRAQKVRHIYAVPGMLFAAGHVKNDVPSVLARYMKIHKIPIKFGRELAMDTRLIRAAGERILSVLPDKSKEYRHETILLTVGRGASDPDANSNISKVNRLLWEGLGFQWAEVGYSGVTFPLTEPALRQLVRMKPKRIVVFPYFLFSGILVERIYAAADKIAAEFPEIEIIKAPYLNDHELVIDTFISRINEIQLGLNNMNCMDCKYRNQVLGFEDEVGLPQMSHHHHVEGIGTGKAEQKHEHNHHAGHDHKHHDHKHHDHNHHDHHGHTHGAHGQGHGHNHDDHGHHPYPHADHPLGTGNKKTTNKKG